MPRRTLALFRTDRTTPTIFGPYRGCPPGYTISMRIDTYAGAGNVVTQLQGTVDAGATWKNMGGTLSLGGLGHTSGGAEFATVAFLDEWRVQVTIPGTVTDLSYSLVFDTPVLPVNCSNQSPAE